jgi:hypothetical protein
VNEIEGKTMKRIASAICLTFAVLLPLVSLAQDANPAPAATDADKQSFSQHSIAEWYSEISHGQQVQIAQTAGIALIAIVVTVFALAATRRVVFYYNLADALWSVAIFLIPIVGAIIAALLTPDNATAEELVVPKYLIFASLGCSAFACLVSIWNSVKYSSSFLIGILVGVLKIVMGLFMLLTVFGMFSSITDRERPRADRAVGVAILGLLFGLLWKLLVNGYAVEERRSLRAT